MPLGELVSEYRPRSGHVVGFGYLWSWEAEAGHDRALKRRPCLIVNVEETPSLLAVRLVPISHRPITKQPFIEIPKGYLQGAGLDGLGCYVIPSEVNTVAWPSRAWDRQLMPKGQVPAAFLHQVQQSLVGLDARNSLVEVDREKLAREIVEAYRDRER